jgi:hypothetical protein
MMKMSSEAWLYFSLCAAIALALINHAGYLLPNLLKVLIHQQLVSSVSANNTTSLIK